MKQTFATPFLPLEQPDKEALLTSPFMAADDCRQSAEGDLIKAVLIADNSLPVTQGTREAQALHILSSFKPSRHL